MLIKQLIIFCVESKNKNEDSDGLYIKTSLNHFYTYDEHDTIIRFIYMNGKYNYSSNKVAKKIKELKRKFSSDDIKMTIFYICDKDNYERIPDDQNFIKNISNFCSSRGYELIWMNKDIEEVFWGHSVAQSDKVKEAAKFKSCQRLTKLNIKNLCVKDAKRKNTSNILLIFDQHFHRK